MKGITISESTAWEMLDDRIKLERIKDVVEFHAIALSKIGVLDKLNAILRSRPYSDLKEG